MFRIEKKAVKGDLMKSRSGIETKRGVEQGKAGRKISLVGIHQKGGLTLA